MQARICCKNKFRQRGERGVDANQMICAVSAKCHKSPPSLQTSIMLSPTMAPMPACFVQNRSDCSSKNTEDAIGEALMLSGTAQVVWGH
jgi:hypothetical protein